MAVAAARGLPLRAGARSCAIRGLRQVLLLMGPGTIGLAATQVNIFVNTLLATSQGTGAVSWLTYAFRLMYLPIGLFGVSIGTAVLPAVSRHAAVDDTRGIRQTVSRGLGADADAQRAGDGRPDRAGDADRATAVRARSLPAVRHRGDGVPRCASMRLGLVGYSAVRIASPTFYAIGAQPDAGDGQRESRSSSTLVASLLLVRAARVPAGSRSARRSRRLRTLESLSGC